VYIYIVLPIELPILDEELATKLLEEAQRRKVSPQTLAQELLRQGLGARPHYHDLDGLTGTWSEAEAEAFLKAIALFEEVDKTLWCGEYPLRSSSVPQRLHFQSLCWGNC
jgi:hypothetical protein